MLEMTNTALKQLFYLIVLILVLIYAFWFILIKPAPANYRSCDFYTEQLNGGTHAFQGHAYQVVLCGIRGRIDPGNIHRDEVRLTILSMDNELLLERYYHPLLGMGDFGLELKYGDDYLAFETEDQGPTQRIKMPPGYFEWIRARLPRLLP